MRQPFEGVLEQLQDRVYQELRSLNDFQKIAIVAQKRSSLESFCEQLIQQNLGEGIFIAAPLPKKIVSEVAGPVYEQIELAVQIVENVATNESGHSALFLAEHVAHHLHMKKFIFGEQAWNVYCRDKDPWACECDAYRNVITLYFMTQYSF